jgi:hypothetical protein
VPKTKADKLQIAAEAYIQNVYIKPIPKYSWINALADAAYAPSTVKARCAELWTRAEDRILELKKRLEINRKWDLAWIDQQYRDLQGICRLNSDRTNEKGCLDSMSRRLSGFTDNINDKRNGDDIDIPKQDQGTVAEACRALNMRLSKPKTGTNDD